MRNVEKAIIVLIGIEFIFTAVSFFILPDICAMHWSQKGTTYKDKIAVFNLPLIATTISAILIVISRWYSKRDPIEGETLNYVSYLTSFIIIVFTYIGLILILAANL